MLKTYGIFFLSLIISLFLFIGGSELRIQRAEFLNKTIFLPYSYSITSIKKHKNLLKKNKQLFIERNQFYLQTINLKNLIQKLDKSKISFENNIDQFIVADVVGYHGNLMNKTLTLNKGFIDSVEVSCPVITNRGVLGKIINTSAKYSTLLPVNHPEFRLGVLDKNSRVQGILTNNLFGQSFMSMIPLESEISVGDTIVTSNFSSIFPKSIPVGIVKSINTTSDQLHIRATLELFADVGNVEEVMILDNKRRNYEEERNNN